MVTKMVNWVMALVDWVVAVSPGASCNPIIIISQKSPLTAPAPRTPRHSPGAGRRREVSTESLLPRRTPPLGGCGV